MHNTKSDFAFIVKVIKPKFFEFMFKE